MYPRNAASPERIAVGQVVLIADGTIQSAAVVVTVRGQGGAEAGSAGTIEFGGVDNTVYYTPTQAETNFTSFTLTASKAACLSAGPVTVVTTASSTPGLVVLAATGLDLIVSTATGMVEIAKAIWDRVLTGATHNIASSAGRRLRTLGSNAIFDGTASAGDADSITLAGGSATDGLYVGAGISIVGGTGEGQSRYIVSYDGTTKVAEVARHWTVNPSSDSEFVVTPDHQIDFIDMGVAQAGGAASITLASTAETIDDTYKGTAIRIMSGTGDHQIRMITAYNGTTKVATVFPAWETPPDSTSSYATLNTGPANVVTVDSASQTAGDLANLLAGVDTKQDTAKTVIDQILADQDSMGITKNAAFSNFEFPMVLTSDHYTAATSKTVTGERSIDGAAFASVAGTIAEVGSGVYQIDLLAADTNGDVITYKFSATDSDDTIITVTTRI